MVTIAVRASCPNRGRCLLAKSPEPVQQSGLDPATSRMLDALLGNDSVPAAAASDAIRRLLVLLEVADTVTQRLSLDHQLPRLIELIVEVLDADRATLFLHDADTGELFSRVAGGEVYLRFASRRALGSPARCSVPVSGKSSTTPIGTRGLTLR